MCPKNTHALTQNVNQVVRYFCCTQFKTTFILNKKTIPRVKARHFGKRGNSGWRPGHPHIVLGSEAGTWMSGAEDHYLP